jgi:hypothetical protein
LSLRGRASEVLRVENQGACAGQDERRETLQTCGPNIVDLSTTRPLSTSRTGTDWMHHAPCRAHALLRLAILNRPVARKGTNQHQIR